jgi:hypothetical protein
VLYKHVTRQHKVQRRFNLIYYPKVSHGTQSQAIGNFSTEAMTNSSCAPLNPFLGQSTSEKLMKGNHALRKTQILTVVRGARLEDFLTGATKAPEQKIQQGDKEVANPLYEQWKATDQ